MIHTINITIDFTARRKYFSLIYRSLIFITGVFPHVVRVEYAEASLGTKSK